MSGLTVGSTRNGGRPLTGQQLATPSRRRVSPHWQSWPHLRHTPDQDNCPNLQACTTWCPGDPNPAGRPVPWDTGVCHEHYWDSYGVHDVGNGAFYPWATMPW